MTNTTGQNRTPLFGGDAFEQIVAILMTLIVIQTAVITLWFALADDSNGDAGRDAQIFALQGLGKRAVGSMRASYDETGAFQRWIELETLAKLAEQRDDPAGAERLRAARDRVAKLSPLLNAPYLNEGETTPDLYAYQADTFLTEAIALSERFENQARLKAQWSDRASSYTVMLTLLALTLFVLGVSTSSPRRVRTLFFAMGVVLAVGVLVWMLLTYFQPTTSYPDDAINAYARGYAELYKGNSEKAVTEFDHAIQLAPKYTNAFRERAFTKYLLGNNAGAAADFENARAAGDASSETASSLAFAYYLLGRFDEADRLNVQALGTSPNEMWIRFNYALGMLANGQTQNAQQEYDKALQQAAKIVADARSANKEPPAALWLEFDEGVNDLDKLAACASSQECDGAPPFASLKNPSDVARVALETYTKLKEYSVALEYTSKPPPAHVDAQVEPFSFTREFSEDDEPVNVTDTFAATDEPIYVLIRFRNLRDGQQIAIKVYVDEYEDDRLRVVQDYSTEAMGGADGDVFLAITTGGVPLTPGAYHVEMYVESKLVQTGDFTVADE